MVVALGAWSQTARAELPMSGAVLGHMEAVLEHCGRVSPANGELYKQLVKVLTGDAKDEELAEVRKSAEYREAHDAATDELDAQPKEKSQKACVEGMEAVAK
jgi:hypothetical protein